MFGVSRFDAWCKAYTLSRSCSWLLASIASQRASKNKLHEGWPHAGAASWKVFGVRKESDVWSEEERAEGMSDEKGDVNSLRSEQKGVRKGKRSVEGKFRLRIKVGSCLICQPLVEPRSKACRHHSRSSRVGIKDWEDMIVSPVISMRHSSLLHFQELLRPCRVL